METFAKLTRLKMRRLQLQNALSFLHQQMTPAAWANSGVVLALVAVSLGVVLVAETARIPVDDPTTHLELTMIHEVMILDHGGPDYAFLLYAAALKFWMLATLIVGLLPALWCLTPVRRLVPLAVFQIIAGIALGSPEFQKR